MREIDFLPNWYKKGKRRQISYRTQCVALGGVFVVMMVWNFVTTRSISKATSELTQETARQAEAQSASREFAAIKSEVTRLQKKVKSTEEIDSKIDVESVLAEISFLVGGKIVLNKVEFSAERFAGKQGNRPGRGSAVRAARAEFGGRGVPLVGDVRFKVVIGGVAADAGDVAALICELEDSPYFCQVYPSFSRNMKIRVKAGEDLQVSEFEIGCYLANYREV
ncbi:MAG: hypothetical protein ACYS6W_02570 [Planctomycetota bacterium]|jgi:hypothetical protein